MFQMVKEHTTTGDSERDSLTSLVCQFYADLSLHKNKLFNVTGIYRDTILLNGGWVKQYYVISEQINNYVSH